MGMFKNVLSDVQSACMALSQEESQDYTLAQVADVCGGAVAPDGWTIILDGIPVQMQDDPRWVEAGHQHSLYKQHWPASK